MNSSRLSQVKLFHRGTIRTLDPSQPIAEALAVDGDRIVALGTEDDVRRFAGQEAAAFDLEGGCLCPGFIDAHHHLSIAALFSIAARLDAPNAGTIAELQAQLAAHAARTPRGAWVLGYGYDEEALRERRAPRLGELDEACPDHPVLAVHFSCHEGRVNRRGQEALEGSLDVTAHRGRVVRSWRGARTGLLLEEAVGRALRIAMDEIISHDEGAYQAALAEYEQTLLAAGIVRIFDPGVHPALEAVLRRAHEAGSLRIGLNLMVVGDEGILSAPRSRLEGSPTGTGSARVRIGPLKAFMDGGMGVGLRLAPRDALRSARATAESVLRTRSLAPLRLARTVGLRPGPDGMLHGGWLCYQPAEARELFHLAAERGFAVAVHAIGNEAIDRAIETLPTSAASRPAGVGPHRVEHFLVTEPGQARRAAERGLAAAVQPAFIPLLAERMTALGFPAPERMLPLREMLDAGMCLAGSSDAPVTDVSPIYGMWCATTRELPTGRPFARSQCLQPEEALAMYTRGAATAGGIEHECGTLAVDKQADLVWLSDDPVRHGALAAHRPRVRGTWVGGERLYAS